jgi:hypothetical protein
MGPVEKPGYLGLNIRSKSRKLCARSRTRRHNEGNRPGNDAMGIGLKVYKWSLLALSLHRTKTMHQLLCVKSKFPNHFAFTCSYYLWSSLFNVDDESLHTLDN